MQIWFAMCVPVMVTAVIWALWPRRLAFWEIPIPFAITFLFCLIMKLSVEGVQTRDTEYWTGWIHTAEYYERWTEEWDEYVPESGHTDDKGNYVVDTPAHWEHHVAHHPPYWVMYGSNKEELGIDEGSYRRLCGMWGMNQFKKLSHHNQTSVGDGNMYFTRWNQKRETMITCTTEHSYTNRVQASHSIFNFRKFKKEEVKELGLFDYPRIKDVTEVPSILGDGGPTAASANRFLQIRNAELGAEKQVRMWILVFHNSDQQVALDQESYWCGGNKNEMVLCIGVDKDYNMLWSYPFSWTEEEQLKIEIRQLAFANADTGRGEGPKLDLNKVAAGMSDLVQKQFVRKHFSDFNYLAVEPPFGAVIAAYIVAFIFSIGISFWLLLNEFENEMVDEGTGLAAMFEDGTATSTQRTVQWIAERRQRLVNKMSGYLPRYYR